MTAKRLVTRIGTSSEVPRLIPGELGYDTDTKVARIGDDTMSPPGILTSKTESFDLTNLKNLQLSTEVLDLLAKRGTDGWTPVLATESHFDREILKVVDWTDGVGDKPFYPVYVSETGFTTDPVLATNLKGKTGSNASGPVISFTINNGALIMNVLNSDDTMGPIAGHIDSSGHLIVEYAAVNNTTITTDLGKVVVTSRGLFNIETTYYPLDEVAYNNKLYRLKHTSNSVTGILPTNTVHWTLVYSYTLASTYSVQVDDLAGRAAYDSEPVGFSVLVSDTGNGRAAIYERIGSAGNWTAPAYLAVEVTKADIGLGNADNTSDIDKPVSDPQMDAIRRYATATNSVDNWLIRGPDGALPVQQSEFVRGCGWYNGIPTSTMSDYMDLANATYTRASSSTYFDKYGIIQTAGPNEWRLDHDPATGEPLGILVEGQSTNLLLNSGFSGAVSGSPGTVPTNWIYYGNTGSTVVSASRATGGNKIAFFSGSPGRQIMAQSATVQPNATYLFSAEVNASGASGLSQHIHATSTPTGATIERLVDGVVNAPLSDGKHILALRLTTASAGGTVAFQLGAGLQSNITNATLEVDVPQLEVGTLRSSYIPTAGATATRMADNLSFAISPAAEGTVVIRARTALGGGAQQVLWQADAGSANERIFVARTAGGALRALVIYGGTTVVTLNLGVPADGEEIEVAFSWMQGRFAASLNGGEPVVETSYTGPVPALSRSFAGGVNGVSAWFGTIARTVRWDKAYSPSLLQEIANPIYIPYDAILINYAVSIYNEDGIEIGEYYADRLTVTPTILVQLYGEVISEDLTAEVDFYVQVNGSMVAGPYLAKHGAPISVSLRNLNIDVNKNSTVGFVVTSSNANEFFGKVYGAAL